MGLLGCGPLSRFNRQSWAVRYAGAPSGTLLVLLGFLGLQVVVTVLFLHPPDGEGCFRMSPGKSAENVEFSTIACGTEGKRKGRLQTETPVIPPPPAVNFRPMPGGPHPLRRAKALTMLAPASKTGNDLLSGPETPCSQYRIHGPVLTRERILAELTVRERRAPMPSRPRRHLGRSCG